MDDSNSNRIQRTLFIRDATDLPQPTSHTQAHFLTSNISVYHQLIDQGIEVSGTWQYVDYETRKQVITEALHLKDDWYKQLRGPLTYRGINMGDAIKFPFYHFLWEALTSEKIAERFFSVNHSSMIRLPAFSGTPARYSLAQRSDVPEAVVAYCAERLGVSIEWNRRHLKNSLFRLVRRFVPARVRRIRRQLLDWLSDDQLESGAHNFLALPEALSSLLEGQTKYRAVAASGYQSLLMLIPATAYLELRGDWSTLLIHTGDKLDYRSLLTDSRASDFIDMRQLESFRYLEIFAASPAKTRAHKKFTKRAWHGFVEWQKNYEGPYSSVFSNPYLEFQYKYLLTDLLEELCRVVDAAYDIFEQTRLDVLLVGNVSEKDLTMASVAQVMNVPSVLVPHNLGWASPEDYEYAVDYIAVQNEGTARFLEAIVGPRQLLVAGDFKRKRSDWAAGVKADPRQSGEEPRTTILVLTGGFTPGVFQNCDPGAFYASLKALVSYADQKLDWKVIFRAHPRLESFEWIRDLVNRTQGYVSGRITVETRTIAEEIIPRVDVVLMLDYISGPAITAWKEGIPIIYWSSSQLIYSLNDMLRADWFPQVTNCSELEQMIDRFIGDEEWRNQWISKGHELANEYFSPPELPETIFADMLTKICQKDLDETKRDSGDLSAMARD